MKDFTLIQKEEREQLVKCFLERYTDEVTYGDRVRLNWWVNTPNNFINASGVSSALTPNQVFIMIQNEEHVAKNKEEYSTFFNCTKGAITVFLQKRSWVIYRELYKYYIDGKLD